MIGWVWVMVFMMMMGRFLVKLGVISVCVLFMVVWMLVLFC